MYFFLLFTNIMKSTNTFLIILSIFGDAIFVMSR